jgi:hypothetical protein
MLRRISANVLLQSVIAIVVALLIALLATGAWDAWRTLGTATRLERIAQAAAQAFRAMHNLRLDRSFTVRSLNLDRVDEAKQLEQIAKIRAAELPALAATLSLLRGTDMPNGTRSSPSSRRARRRSRGWRRKAPPISSSRRASGAPAWQRNTRRSRPTS